MPSPWHPSLVAQNASCQDADVVRHLLHLSQDVAGYEHGHAPVRKAPQHGAQLLDAKGNLIRKALGITDLRIEVLDDRVAFPWFSQVDADSAAAYTHFISALCEMSKNAKRVTATEKPVDNEKYAFRCFLLRLGFIGAEYKMERKILLKNLSGNSAFKTKVDVLQPEPVPSAMYVAADENPDLTEALLDEILIQQVNREMEDDRNEISE